MRLLAILAAATFSPGCIEMGDPPTLPQLPDGGSASGVDAGIVAPPDAEPVAVDPMAQWSGCMLLVNWNAANMGSWAQKPAEGGTVCASCHGDGLARFNADSNADLMFAYNRYEVFIGGFFTLATAADGTLDVITAKDKLKLKGSGISAHPTYATGDADPYFSALETFHLLTWQARRDGICGPPIYPTGEPAL
jgi:hypothetical protein